MPKRMAVVVDYQNVHLTGTELFLPERPVEEGLVDPFRFACQLAKARNDGSPPEHAVEVARVEVFRGLPSDQDDARAYARNLAQRSEWMKGHHGVVEVTLRPLKYDYEYRDGARSIIRGSRREKGVDVLCALALVRLARSGLFDVVVLASRDTDLAPALDEAAKQGSAKIEAAKWYEPSAPHTRGRLATEQRIWTTSMRREHFMDSLDQRDYTGVRASS